MHMGRPTATSQQAAESDWALTVSRGHAVFVRNSTSVYDTKGIYRGKARDAPGPAES